MARSLSLSAYMALARRTPGALAKPTVQRPKGSLVWAHVETPARAGAILQMLARLAPIRKNVSLLLTCPKDMTRPELPDVEVFWQDPPEESTAEIEAFLNGWSPDLCLWTGGNLRPALIVMASEKNTPMFLIDADGTCFGDTHWHWLPKMAKDVLGHFHTILANSANAAIKLQRLGAPEAKLTVTGPLQDGGAAFGCNPSDRAELSSVLTGRPVWLAAYTQRAEIETVLAAHKAASRKAHRLLLIIAPDDPADGPMIREHLESDGWRFLVWSEGVFPDENTQVLLADTRGEMGLWYRVAPVTFMASSLVTGFGGRDPFEPAALGSAIIYGPSVSNHLATYTRFANAGAARIIKDADSLAAAVTRLIAADQSASMALAAWEVSSQGAEATDRVIELVQDALDTRKGGHART